MISLLRNYCISLWRSDSNIQFFHSAVFKEILLIIPRQCARVIALPEGIRKRFAPEGSYEISLWRLKAIRHFPSGNFVFRKSSIMCSRLIPPEEI